MTITPRTDHLIDLALDEDAGLGDVTSRAIFPAQHTSRAIIEAKQMDFAEFYFLKLP